MPDYIMREDAIALIEEQTEEKPKDDMDIGWNAGLSCAIGQLETIPKAKVTKHRSGKWTRKEVKTREFGRLLVVECSKCKKNQTYRTKYCPNCGAEMGMPDV